MTKFLDRLRAWDKWDPPVQGWGEVVKVVNAPEPVSLSECANEIERLNAKIAQLREALKPFACNCGPYCCRMNGDDGDRDNCTALRARAALAEEKK